ncbi:MAG: LacI family DNA-binding transcriptional regulator [Acidobacteria bacterium]|nr:LacI family DNA-binding transcriptional regulator [Acidobacteriota bacterium]
MGILGPVNMREIARRAGVSCATVSRVLSGSSLVREDTAKKVRDVVSEAGFIPNPSAAMLKYGRSRTYGLVLPDLQNPFFGEFVGAFEDLLIDIDHEVLPIIVQTSDKLVKSVRRMLMRQVDGAVLVSSEFDTGAAEPLLLRQIPLVTVDRRTVQIGCSDVSIDYERGFAEAVQHLKTLGHKRIGYIGGTKGPHTSEVRANAFEQAIRGAGLTFYPGLTRRGNYQVTGGEAAIVSLMKTPAPPTAIITANDLTALGAALGIHRLGLAVPRDLSIVGVDDLFLSEVVQPPLTTIRIPRKRLATACLQAMNYTKQNLERMGAEFSVPTQLIVRESTARPKSAPKKKSKR